MFAVLGKDKEWKEQLEEGQQGHGQRNQLNSSGGGGGGGDGDGGRDGGRAAGDKADLVAADLSVDPGLVLRHSRVYSWKTCQAAASAETHHAALGPRAIDFGHQRATRIPLHGSESEEAGKD